MIEISVSGLKKSFEIGNNILDGITFQVETGERVEGHAVFRQPLQTDKLRPGYLNTGNRRKQR